MSLVLISKDLLFTGISEGSDGTVSQLVSYEFETQVKTADVVLKAFSLVHKARDNNFYQGAAKISNVSHQNNTVQATVTLQLSDNSDHTLDPNKVQATVLFIADCE